MQKASCKSLGWVQTSDGVWNQKLISRFYSVHFIDNLLENLEHGTELLMPMRLGIPGRQ